MPYPPPVEISPPDMSPSPTSLRRKRRRRRSSPDIGMDMDDGGGGGRHLPHFRKLFEVQQMSVTSGKGGRRLQSCWIGSWIRGLDRFSLAKLAVFKPE